MLIFSVTVHTSTQSFLTQHTSRYWLHRLDPCCYQRYDIQIFACKRATLVRTVMEHTNIDSNF